MPNPELVKDASREELIAAMDKFDAELRDSKDWQGWEDKKNHKYAILHEGKRYPVKEIIHLATGVPVGSFSGGTAANGYMEKRGFKIVKLRGEDLLFEFEETDFVEGTDGTTWRGRLAIILREQLTNIIGEPVGGGGPYNTPAVYLFDQGYKTVYVFPRFVFGFNGVTREYYYGLVVEKGKYKTETSEQQIKDSWSWWGLLNILENSQLRDRFRTLVIENGFEIYQQFFDDEGAENPKVFRPKNKDELEVYDQVFGLYDGMWTWLQLAHHTRYFSVPPNNQWCDFLVRKTGVVGEDNTISLEPVVDAWEVLSPLYYEIIANINHEEIFLIIAAKDNAELTPYRDFLKLNSRAAIWASYPIKEGLIDTFERQIPFKCLVYSKGQMRLAANVVEFVTKSGGAGIESPWPDSTLPRDRDKKQLSDSKAEHFKTWLLVDKIDVLDPPESLDHFVRYQDASPIPPVALKGGFAFAKRRKDGEGSMDLYNYFESNGYHFPKEVITNYYVSLKTKPFVILSGISGTGKTKIAQVFADFMCPPEQTQISELPENEDHEFYIRVGKWLYNLGGLNITAILAEYFNIPEKGESGAVNIEFDGEKIASRIINIGYKDPKYSETKVIYLRKQARKWINASFEIGDIMKVTVLDDTKTNYRLEKYEPQMKSIETRRAVFIPVRPDWMDNRGLLGFYNILTGTYQPTELLKLMLRAANDPERPYFVILDEMNLAKVEYYFSDFLSCLESRRLSGSDSIKQEAIPLHEQEDDLEFADSDGTVMFIPAFIEIPQNLYFTGTVNVDESTYMFSPKVLDRANTIEFNEVDLPSYGTGDHISTGSEFSLTANIDAVDSFTGYKPASATDYRALDEQVRAKIEELNSLLQPWHLHFGYRVANEMALYVNNAVQLTGAQNTGIALDLQVLQKVLPKFHGSRQGLEKPLLRLMLFCCGQAVDDSDDYVSVMTKCEQIMDQSAFPRSAKKIYRMLKSLHDVGFVSFIE